MQPASDTKHIPTLTVDFNHTTRLDVDDREPSTANTLWIGGQVLAAYIQQFHPCNKHAHPQRVVELGSGVGLTALAIASLGYHVLATDLSSAHLLKSNIAFNKHALPPDAGTVKAMALDWTELPPQWNLADEGKEEEAEAEDHFRPPFRLIITADTIYKEELVQPLLRSLHALALESTLVGSTNSPLILVCLERRDPLLIDSAFERARNDWGFKVQRVPATKVRRAVEKGLRCEWGDGWSAIELWKLKLNVPKMHDATMAS